MTGPEPADPRDPAFYERSVHELALALLGCTLRHARTAGRIVEVESYHQEEAACHAHAGLTPRTRPLFGPPGHAYVYRSYGIHALFNVVAEREGIGAAVLVRALEPREGIEVMRERRAVARDRDLCAGPGRLTQALDIRLEHDGTALRGGPIELEPRPEEDRA
ncbi:MAG TPA: DNA-3-methyladenine glycosylase, partial [Thermoleophilaceae bacterium]|nr:DNA-3-methyladenine glycosylase [Thermoleophilaceae bacterium]